MFFTLSLHCKTIKQPVILPAKWVYLGAANNCSSGHATICESGKAMGRKLSHRGEAGLGGAVIGKKSIGPSSTQKRFLEKQNHSKQRDSIRYTEEYFEYFC